MKHLKFLGTQLYRLRKRKGLTQTQLALALDVQQSYIAKLENAREDKQPTIDFLLRVGEFFNVGLDDLLGTHRGGEVPGVGINLLSSDIREPLEALIMQLARKERETQWETQSTITKALGGADAVLLAEHRINVRVTPDDDSVVSDKAQIELF